MRERFPLLLLLALSCTASANHPNTEIDLCEIYQDKLPPGLTPEALPQPESQGAQLLNHYCTQCHNLPGPDRHTSTEWQEVSSKMFLLSEVSHQFGGWMGHVEKMSSEEQSTLLTYLQRHASNSSDAALLTEEPAILPLWFSRTLALLPVMLLVGFGLFHGYRRLAGDR